MLKLLAGAMLAIFLAGCSTVKDGGFDPTARLQVEAEVACVAIGATLNVLAGRMDQLSDAAVDRIDAAKQYADQTCLADAPPATTDVVTKLMIVSADLIAARKETK